MSCTTGELVSSIIYTFACSIAIFTILFALVVIIYTKEKKSNARTKMIRTCAIIHVISVIAAIIGVMLTKVGKCYSNKLYNPSIIQIFEQLWLSAIGFQLFTLLLIIFLVVTNVFKDSQFEIPQSTQKFYIFTFITLSIFMTGTVIIWAFVTPLTWTIIASFGMVIIFGPVVSLLILFVKRLLAVYKLSFITSPQADQTLVHAITKATLLMTISLFISNIHFIMFIVDLFSNTTYLPWVHAYLALFDFYTNFLCVVINLTSFSKHYHKLCGYFDTKCRLFWKMVANKISKHEFETERNLKKQKELAPDVSKTDGPKSKGSSKESKKQSKTDAKVDNNSTYIVEPSSKTNNRS